MTLRSSFKARLSRRPWAHPVHAGRLGLGAVGGTLALVLASAGAAQAAAPGSVVSSAVLGANTALFGSAAEADGSAVAAGQSGGRVFVEHINSAGHVDRTYTGPAGYARAVAVEGNGDVVVAGTNGSSMLVERLTSSLSPDGSFGSGGVATAFGGQAGIANAVGIESDGSVVAAGQVGAGTTIVGAARFSASGGVEWANSLNLGPDSVVNGLAVQSNGAIVIAGSQRGSTLQVTNGLIGRLTSGGALDSSFAGTGAKIYFFPNTGYTSFNAVALQSNGQIVAVGSETGGPSAIFVRYSSNGSQDGSFGSGGVASLSSSQNLNLRENAYGAFGAAIAGGGTIVGVGNFDSGGVEVDAAQYALTSGGAADSALTGGNGTVSGGPGALRGPENGYELCGVSVTPNGNLVAVGETIPTFNDTNPCGVRSGSAGFEITYTGFGPIPFNQGGGGALKLSVSGISGSYKDKTVGKSGLKFTANCNQSCKLSASLVLSASNAKRVKLKTTVNKCTTSHGHKHCKKTSGYNQVTISSASASANGNHTFVLKIKSSYIKALERVNSVSLTLQVTATPSSGKSSSVKKTVTFKR
jgi:uncharacterized delta-60 repeat protein